MHEKVDNPMSNTKKAIVNSVDQKKGNGLSGFRFLDNRPKALSHILAHSATDSSPQNSVVGANSNNVVQAMRLKQARRDIAEDRDTLIREYYEAKKYNREQDMSDIMEKQRDIPTKPPALIPMGWTPDDQFSADVSLYDQAAEMLEEYIAGKYCAKIARQVFKYTDLYFAQDFCDAYNSKSNPMVPFHMLESLKNRGVLSVKAILYRRSTGGQNGMIYEFTVRGSSSVIAEWHVHWESGNKAGSPGWKRGKDGDKIETGNEMRSLLGDLWGEDKSSGGYVTL